MSRPGSSRINNELIDCWSGDVPDDKTRRHRKGQQGAKRSRESSEEDSDKQTARENEEYDRRHNPGKFAQWDRAEQQSSSAKRRKTRKHDKSGKRSEGHRRASKQDRLEEQLARIEKIMSACLPVLPVVPVGVRASAETPKHKYTQDKKDDGKDLAKKVNHCHRQKESSEQQQRREEKRVKTLAKAITMSAWLFGGTFQLFDINLNSVPQ